MPTCKKCGEVVGALEITEGLCEKCATSENLDEIREINRQEEKDLVGIKGSLVLIAIILALNLAASGLFFLNILNLNNTPMILFAFVTFILTGYLNYLFYAKKRIFPKVFIWLTIAGIVVVSLSLLIMLFNGALYTLPIKDILRILIAFGLISYMKNSKRVKATFVN